MSKLIKKNCSSPLIKASAQKEEILPSDTWHNHLIELRKRILLCLITIVIITSIAMKFAEQLYGFISQPLLNNFSSTSHKLIFTNITEGFSTQMKISFVTSLFFTFPLIIYQLYFFIAPGLYKREKKIILPYIISSPLLFFTGSLLAYKIIMPEICHFFISFEGLVKSPTGITIPIQLEAKISEYLDFAINMVTAFGLAFQLPIALVMLVKFKILQLQQLLNYRRHAIVLIFIISAVLTPPDVLSQVSLAIPLVVLYEITIVICRKFKKDV